MTPKFRKFLYLFFILLFFIITPMAWSMAAGYRFNFSKMSLQKTGMLIINSEPEDAVVYINNKKIQKTFQKLSSKLNFKNNIDNRGQTTPAKIKNLLPGEYNIKLEKNGYISWEKKLKIEPNKATFAEDIMLFRKDIPSIIQNGGFTTMSVSENKKYLIAINEEKIVYSKKPFSVFETIDTKLNLEKNTEILWSKNQNSILIGLKVINLENSTVADLKKVLGQSSSKAIWNPENNNSLYILNSQGLSDYNLESKTTTNINQNKNCQDFIIRKDKVLTIKKENEDVVLEINKLNNGEIIKTITLPQSNGYSFSKNNSNKINIEDKQHEIIYIIDIEDTISPLKNTINNIKTIEWIDQERALCANDFEIFIFDTANSQKTLLTRISQKIEKIIWHRNNNYVLYSTADTIYAIELDNRQNRNITKIFNSKEITEVYSDQNFEALYLLTDFEDKNGIYRLPIY